MRTLLAAAALALTLPACSPSDEAAAPVEESPTGLVITNARLLLPPLAGNPAAVYFELSNQGTKAVAIRRADVEGAKSASIHGMMDYNGAMSMTDMVPTAIKRGETIKFAPGAMHVMAFDLSPELKAGGKTELTLTIAGGDKVSAEVPIQAAGAER